MGLSVGVYSLLYIDGSLIQCVSIPCSSVYCSSSIGKGSVCFAAPWTVACQAPVSTEFFQLQGIFPTQELNLCLLHWQTDSLPPCHLESRPLKDLLSKGRDGFPSCGRGNPPVSPGLNFMNGCENGYRVSTAGDLTVN